MMGLKNLRTIILFEKQKNLRKNPRFEKDGEPE
jgi:hypothetical protein